MDGLPPSVGGVGCVLEALFFLAPLVGVVLEIADVAVGVDGD